MNRADHHILICTLFMLACCSAVAFGDGTAVWVELDNSVNPANGNPTGLDDGSFDGTVYRTFDLFIVLPPAWDGSGVEGKSVGAMDFGVAAQNTGLITDGLFFQAPEPFNSDRVVVNEEAAAMQNQVYFDTAVALGSAELQVTGGPAVNSILWDETGVFGAWWPTTGRVHADKNGLVFSARITVDSSAMTLGGECFVSDFRVPDFVWPPPSIWVHSIPNAFKELECLGDITWDGVVDTADLGRLLTAFGSGWGDDNFNPRADFTRDGVVDTADLGRLLVNFRRACP